MRQSLLASKPAHAASFIRVAVTWVLHRSNIAILTNRCVLLLAGFLPALAACSGTVQWRQEVRLNDGRVVVVNQKRRCAGGDYTAAMDASCVATEAWLSFCLPETSNREVSWHQRLNPMVMNVHQGQVYVVGYPVHPSEFRAYGGTNPPYIGFVLQDGQWRRIPFGRIPVEIYEGNLLIESIPKMRTKYLSLSARNGTEENGDPRYPAHRRRIDPKFIRPLL